MSKIEIRNLTKHFGSEVALDSISLDIENAEFLVLLGPSGCGKTTLLRCIAGLETPDSGEIVIGGKVVYSADRKIQIQPGKRNLGMVFQSYALWPHMSVRNNIKFGLDVLNTPQDMSDNRLDQVLEDVGMGELGERYPSELSGGQQQRVALARLLATQPPVFLMDEPLSNLDARLRMDMRVELKKFQARAAATTVYVTHDQTEAMTMSTRVVVMKSGQIQQVSPPHELYRNPANTFVADFIGMPRINLIELDAKHGGANQYGNEDVCIDIGWSPNTDQIVLGARPEDLVVSTDDSGAGESYEVSAVLPNGPETILQLSRGDTVVLARVGHDTSVKTGQAVKVDYVTSALNIYERSTSNLVTPNM